MKKFVLLAIIISLSITSKGQLNNEIAIKSIPHEITWVHKPLSWNVENNVFTLVGGKGSRLFTDPQEKNAVDTAPIALFKPDENFLFSCKVKVDFLSVFDAGVLMIYSDTDLWAKLCFEYTPQLKHQVVSVVNKKYSDDNNHEFIDTDEVYMRIAGLGGGAYAFHYSLDGNYWHMVRYFYLGTDENLKIGFLSQSPRGEFCKTQFSEIKYSKEKLDEIRSGK